MKVTSVEYWQEDLNLLRPYKISGEELSRAGNAFIRIDLSNGMYGIGAASPSERVCGESIEKCMDGLASAADILEGEDLRYLGRLSRDLHEVLGAQTPAALAAADMAVMDAWSKSQGIRIVDYFGKARDGIATSITIGIKDDTAVKNDLEEYMGRGFRVVKMKIGDDLDRDVRIVGKLREWGGSQLGIRVDANQGYTTRQFAEFVERTAEIDIEFVEQPLMAPASVEMRQIDADLRQCAMADEDLKTRTDAAALSEEPLPYGLWNIKLMKSGGITNSKWIGDFASMRGIPLMWGCMDESIVSITAALHTAYSCRMTTWLDLDGSLDLERDIVKGGFVVRDGRMYLTDAPGLGVELL